MLSYHLLVVLYYDAVRIAGCHSTAECVCGTLGRLWVNGHRAVAGGRHLLPELLLCLLYLLTKLSTCLQT